MNNTFKVGELLNERTPLSKTWLNFDGSRTTELSSEILHFKDTEGNYHNISTELFDEADLHNYHDPLEITGAPLSEIAKDKSLAAIETGSMNRDDFDYQALKVPFALKLPKIFSRGYVIGDGADVLSFKPVDASAAKGYIGPDKNEITYSDAWNDTDVKLAVKQDGVKEYITLKSNNSPSVYMFEVTGKLTDELKAGNMQLESAWAIDAAGDYRSVSQELVVDEDTGKTQLVLTVDTADLVYPVLVDPTITVSNTIGSIGLENDVRYNNPNATFQNPVSANIGYLDTYRIFLKYPNLLNNIPANAQIISADYNIYVSNASGPTDIKAAMYAVMTDYNAGALTWNNQPAMDNTLKSPDLTFSVTYNKWIAFDVKNILQAMVNGTAVKAFGIKTVDSGNSGCIFRLSKNSAFNLRPNFNITFNMPPDKPTVVKPNGGEAWNSLETVQWTAANDIKDFVYEPFPFSYGLAYQESTSYGQVFTVPDDNAVLKKIALNLRVTASGATYVMYLSRAKSINGTWTFDKTQILAQQDVTIPDPVNPQWVELNLPNIALPKGTHIAAHIEMKNGNSTTYFASVSDSYFDQAEGNGIINGSNSGYNFLYRLDYSSGTPTNQLTYQIQLSSNNGSTWKTIVNATPAGATSYAYDFINETESATSKVRIRAYDGIAYSDWDESNGVFTIVHNVAPTTPTNLTPNGTIEDRATQTPMTWTHNDPNGNDPQSKFDLQWRVQGVATWNTITQATTNQYYNAAANLFPAGKIEWRVRTYDQAGLAGPYSPIALFTAAVRTAPPTAIYPTNGASVPIARPTVQWSHPNQVKFWLRVKLTSTGAIVFDHQATAANKALTITTDLINNTAYTLELAVMDEQGLWSTFTTVPFQVSYTAPNKPVLSSENDHTNGHIKLMIESNDPAGTAPVISHYDIFRKEPNGDFIKIVDGLNAAGTAYEKKSTLTSDFKGKVLGSTVENANKYMFGNHAVLQPPSAFTAEITNQGHYNNIMNLDNVRSRVTIATVGNHPQALFRYDVLRMLEDHFGPSVWGGKTSLADKVAIARVVILELYIYWMGFGNNIAGYRASLSLWSNTRNVWENTTSTINSTVTQLRVASAAIGQRISDDGYMDVLAYADQLASAGTGVTETDYTKIDINVSLKGTAVQWTDYTPAPNVSIEYFVRAYGVNGTVIDSDVFTTSVKIKNVQIALASDPSQYVTLEKRDAGKETSSRLSATNNFEGRPFPMTDFSDNYERSFDYRYKAWSYGDVVMMRHLALSGEALLLRDNWGRKDYVTIDAVDIEETRSYHAVSFQPMKIYYVEGIL